MEPFGLKEQLQTVNPQKATNTEVLNEIKQARFETRGTVSNHSGRVNKERSGQKAVCIWMNQLMFQIALPSLFARHVHKN
jgi:hypothetical protein